MPVPRRPSSRRSPKSNDLDRQVKQVVLGNLLFQTWFDSLYPEELVKKGTELLYVCRWCFRYSCDAVAYTGHIRRCKHRPRPPGTRIYRDGSYSVWEVDGEDHKLFAQNLSLFAKLFLDHKSVFFDVSCFLYYLLVYTNPDDPNDYHILGYFSKEKMSWDPNNLACILIFPPYQHKQLGKLLMGVSYKLSGWEHGGRIGGPERPLSKMGERSYIRFWEERLARFFLLGNAGEKPREAKAGSRAKKIIAREEMTISEIGQATGMLTEDVITALKSMGIVEAEQPNKRRKRHSSEDQDDDLELAVVRKQNVLDWVKGHGVSLLDPVKEEGFSGQWAIGQGNVKLDPENS
ncbi:hypothetical protein VTO42DRAFT_932 [Malbranchea cinnamomea]